MASSDLTSTGIVHLAHTISTSVAKIQAVLARKEISSPSFNEDYSFNLPPEVSKDLDAVLDATAELHDLLLEPLNLIHRHGGHNNSSCLQAISAFRIADMVPDHGSVSFEDIASKTPMSPRMTARILRHAMTMRIFREVEPGMVAHTAASKLLAHSAANDWLLSGVNEMWPAATKMIEALEKWPNSQEPNETGYALSKNSTKTIYEIFANDAELAARWARGMQVFSHRPQFDLSYVTDHYDWTSAGHAKVVDIGGSQGHLSVALARRFSNLDMVVQDVENVIQHATVPEDLRERIHFMAHDMFQPQPVKGADIYFMRWVLHSWSDKYCILILRALVPALERGARIIIQETLMPEPGTIALWKEKNLRATDINMAAAFNSQERTVAEFKSLLTEADSRFVLRNVIEPHGSALGMLEFTWEA